MTFRARNNVEDDIYNLIFTSTPPVDADESRLVLIEKKAQAMHALLRTLKWQHGADIYSLRNYRGIWDALQDRAEQSGASVIATWDGEDHDDRTVAVHVDLMIHVINEVLIVRFPEATPVPQRIG